MKSTVSFLAIFILSTTLLSFSIGSVSAQDETPVDDQQLVETYSPILYFHPAEIFRPQPVDVLVNTARLREERNLWFDINLLNDVSISDLFLYRESHYILDVWYGSNGASDYKNYSAHRRYYEKELRPEVGGPPVVTYAHIVRDQKEKIITIQYWFFYYYNDWFNKHEGDWEMIQVMIAENGDPLWVVYSQHHGGTRRAWKDTQTEGGFHPLVYVALGSHANYFWGEEIYPNGQDIGNARVEILDRTGSSGRIMPSVILTPDRDELDRSPGLWPNLEWLIFGGHWGELALQGDFGGPHGPADKGEQWEEPYTWGMAQPLDTDVWYGNRLRVEVLGEASDEANVSLHNQEGDGPPSSESLGNVALLHSDPPSEAVINADINVPQDLPFSVVVTWPAADISQVTKYFFDDITASSSGTLKAIFEPSTPPSFWLSGENIEIKPTSSETFNATWDAPDLIWAAGHLPASDVVKGVTISLLAGLIPTIIYLAALYWSDQYEKEPISLLSAALFWGAIPALLIAVAFRLFFRLPFELLGPKAIEAIQIGVFTPFLEEFLKGVIIIFIAWRYRLEFDNVHDGIIYGAVVGFGFSMTGNIVSYLGAFLLRGFAGLSNTIFIEGVLFGLNHALYSAIFGAGVGYARLAKNQTKRYAVPMLTFLLAVTANPLHKIAVHNFLGFNVFSVVITWIGLLGIIALIIWSLRRQRHIMEVELVGEIPEGLYRVVISQRLRRRDLWRALRREGYAGWRRLRYKYQQCAELAFKKMQHQRFPDDRDVLDEMLRLQNLVENLVA
jgi:RsiW-degrading membrane proteinase PrsW (M82 family)